MSLLILTDDLPRGLGYLLVDQRASGIPVSAGRPLFEGDTYTCTHCNAVVILNPDRKRERYKCSGCSHHICDGCAAKKALGEPCITMQQRYEEHLAQVEAEARSGASSPLVLP